MTIHRIKDDEPNRGPSGRNGNNQHSDTFVPCASCVAIRDEMLHQLTVWHLNENPTWTVHRARLRANIDYQKRVEPWKTS
jgi:hypothetical protein